MSYRSLTLWMLGHPQAALADAESALADAREIDHAVTSMNALGFTSLTLIYCGNYARATAALDELVALAGEKRAGFYEASGILAQSFVMALTGRSSAAVQTMVSGYTNYRSTGATLFTPIYLSYLAKAYADTGEFDHARRWITEATTVVGKTKERWWEAEIHRIAGEIALLSPERDALKAQSCFERALEIARAQQARSWELRAAMSLARLWRDQGRRAEAHDLLAPVYAWFTEGFDTLDLKEAKALLEELDQQIGQGVEGMSNNGQSLTWIGGPERACP